MPLLRSGATSICSCPSVSLSKMSLASLILECQASSAIFTMIWFVISFLFLIYLVTLSFEAAEQKVLRGMKWRLMVFGYALYLFKAISKLLLQFFFCVTMNLKHAAF